MTYYSALVMPKDITSSTARSAQRPSFYWAAGPTYNGLDLLVSTSLISTYVNSNNTVLANTVGNYTADYANYIIVNNSSSNWVLTLPLGYGSDTGTWPGACTFHLNIKKTGTGTLTIQTPADTAGTRVRGINTTSNKSYTLSAATEQTITLIYSYGYNSSGSVDSTAEIWYTF